MTANAMTKSDAAGAPHRFDPHHLSHLDNPLRSLLVPAAGFARIEIKTSGWWSYTATAVKGALAR